MTVLSAYAANRMPALAVTATTPTAAPAPIDTSSPASRSRTGFDPAPIPAAASVEEAVGARFGPTMATDFSSAAGGGAISDALKGGVAKIAAWAQRGMTGIQEAIQGDMHSNGGQVDPARMQQYTMEMSRYEMMMQMAAKIQEKEDAAIRVWLR